MVEGLFITRHALYTLHITHCTESLSMANVEYRIAYNQHPPCNQRPDGRVYAGMWHQNQMSGQLQCCLATARLQGGAGFSCVH